MEPRQVAQALHRLVAWGLTEKQVRRHRELLELPSVRRRAMQRLGHGGAEELSRTATQMVLEAVLEAVEPQRTAYRILFGITDNGRLGGIRHGAPRRRQDAIAILASGGYFDDVEVPVPDSWRREAEREFFVPLAQNLLVAGDSIEIPPRVRDNTGEMHHLLVRNPNLDYELITVEGILELFDEQHGRSTVRRTVRALADGAQQYEIGAAAGGALSPELQLDHAELDRRVPPSALGQHKLLLRFPQPLAIGETHTFTVTQAIADEHDGFGYYFHAGGERSAQELHVSVLFPADNPPSEVSRVITTANALGRGGQSRPHRLEGRAANTFFSDLQNGMLYGFRFHWPTPHRHPSVRQSTSAERLQYRPGQESED